MVISLAMKIGRSSKTALVLFPHVGSYFCDSALFTNH
uniref:Uncharacterized protein n=1 Tax=Ciona savignyi TaxID=51511 RepID=H2YTE2_CIOSA